MKLTLIGGIQVDFKKYQEVSKENFKAAKPLEANTARLINWALGLCNEAGELAGQVKHAVFHGEDVNLAEIAKEAGDVLWYLSALLYTAGIDMGACAELNAAKLQHRHGGSYSSEGSVNRHAKEEAFEDTWEYKEIMGRLQL